MSNTPLTPTELKILALLRKGFSSQEAADQMNVSKRTVDFHLANAYQKLQVTNRVQAWLAAERSGQLPPEESK